MPTTPELLKERKVLEDILSGLRVCSHSNQTFLRFNHPEMQKLVAPMYDMQTKLHRHIARLERRIRVLASGEKEK